MPRASRAIAGLATAMMLWGVLSALTSAAAPGLARDFALDDAALAETYGWVGLGACGTVALARLLDRAGRRRVLLGACLAVAPMALLSAAAPSALVYVLSQIAVQALAGTVLAAVTVLVAETAVADRRAGGQAVVATAGSLGNGLALILVAALANVPGSWRWAWVLAALGGLLVASLRQLIPESRYWTAALYRAGRGGGWPAGLRRASRRHAVLVLIGTGLIHLALIGTSTWMIFHLVHDIGLSAALATVLVIAGGAVALAGFPLAGRVADGVGRRVAFMVSALLLALGFAAFYTVPWQRTAAPMLGFATSLAVGMLGMNGSMVAFRALVTELFPTAVRGTVQGGVAVMSAVAAAGAHFLAAGLVHWTGTLGMACAILGLVGAFGAAVCVGLLPETVGRGLEGDLAVGDGQLGGAGLALVPADDAPAA